MTNRNADGNLDGYPARLTYSPETQPYYVSAQEYGVGRSNGSAAHKLCSALNVMGYEAYLDSRDVTGSLWTPLLTEASKVAHFKAGRKPIVVADRKLKGPLKDIGLQVKYFQNLQVPSDAEDAVEDSSRELIYVNAPSDSPDAAALHIPCVDLGMLQRLPIRSAEDRVGVAYFQGTYQSSGGEVRDFGADAVDAGDSECQTEQALCTLLGSVRCLFVYENNPIVDVARLCACPVIFLPNAFTLKELPEAFAGEEKAGVAWGEDEAEVRHAYDTVAAWRQNYLRKMTDWVDSLQSFVKDTQEAANALAFDAAWPQASVDLLALPNLSSRQLAERSDRNKFARVNEQFERWQQHCTIREIDADIYAQHLADGHIQALSVVIDQRGASLDSLADTLDSLAECLSQPAGLIILSHEGAPEQLEGQTDIQWLVVAEGDKSAPDGIRKRLGHWVLLIQSGTCVAAHSLMEWGLAINTYPKAELIYADEDFGGADGTRQHPFFKPEPNIELLRCTNYLGNAVLARTLGWVVAGCPLFDGQLYGYALQLLRVRGREALAHIDTVLVHSSNRFNQQTESQEFSACSRELSKGERVSKLRPLERLGTWLPEYRAADAACVSVVVPTGIQTGYLRSLVESLHRYPQKNLLELILVCSPDQVSEVEYALSSVEVNLPLRIVEIVQESYSHSVALNAGVAEAKGEFILVCDDDTELILEDTVALLQGIAAQPDVGCVAPRLLSNRGAEARITGGPLVLGIQGCAGAYNGESGLLEECGVQSRLQLTQDVGAVAGHFYMFRQTDWQAVGGFDTETFGFWFTTLDFCLRLSLQGKRHVWTPLASVMHQGGRTVTTMLGDTRMRLKYADWELSEKNALLAKWSKQLANDPNYNRHLSLTTPFDIESCIVVDWQPRRKDRPRVLACPLTSGAGQYRVVEPLNALQDASIAQTCTVLPIHRNQTRTLQPLELVRAAPDRLILQHSVDDSQLGMIEKYRLVMPDLPIIQMVDDLLGEVPVKHPNWNFQKREGHQRMVQALKKSDRLIVTTETLKRHYQKYVSDVYLIPNCLDKQWDGLRDEHTPPARLRVGWIGAGQHKGDLDLVAEVVKATADEFDWVFMGMCTDAIKPLIKEFHGFVAIGDYPKKMSSLQLDIAIAPLETNHFNECKSNLRLLEYGAMGWPVVCSDVFPYQTMDAPVVRCSDSVEEWVDALRSLARDEARRLELGTALHAWVQSHYLLKNQVPAWKNAILDSLIESEREVKPR